MRILKATLLIIFALGWAGEAFGALPRHRVKGDARTQNIYGMSLNRGEFHKGAIFGEDGRSMRHNYFGGRLAKKKINTQYAYPYNPESERAQLQSQRRWAAGISDGWTELRSGPPQDPWAYPPPPIIYER